ncbi:MAG: hypothetical protein ABII01_05860, partial [Candidatus Woesearchaeota archaeon]
ILIYIKLSFNIKMAKGKGIYNRDGIERGSYNEDIFHNPKFTKVILLLATGCNTNKELKQQGIDSSIWEIKYKPKLIIKQDDKKSDEHSIEIIKWDGVKRFRNEKGYTFLWDIFLDLIEKKLREDLENNKKDLKQSLNLIEKQRDFQLKRNFEQFKKKKNKKDSKSEISNLDWLKKHGDFIRKKLQLNAFMKEFNNHIKTIDKYLEYISSNGILYLSNSQDYKNYLICQLICYFRKLLLIKDNKLKLSTPIKKNSYSIEYINTFESIMDELKSFMYSITLSGTCLIEIPDESRQFPFNPKLERNELISAFQKYILFSNIKLEWLSHLTPYSSKEEKRAIELFDKAEDKRLLLKMESENISLIKETRKNTKGVIKRAKNIKN